MRRIIGAIAAAFSLAATAQAEPVDGAAARKMLFSPRGVELAVLPDSGLDATQSAIMGAILKQMEGEGLANYYGAVVVSPTFFIKMASDPAQAALSGLLQVSEKLHSPEAAETVALAACTEALSPDDAPCVVAARILPRRWTAQPLTLSVDATQAFKAYRKGRGAKAFAISAQSVAYAIARGENAQAIALESCNADAAAAGSPDCEVVIAD